MRQEFLFPIDPIQVKSKMIKTVVKCVIFWFCENCTSEEGRSNCMTSDHRASAFIQYCTNFKCRFMDPDAVPTEEWLPLSAPSRRIKDQMKVQVH